MPPAPEERRFIQFGAFVADLRTGELRRAERRIRLQILPFQLLVALAEPAGELVSREELCLRLWPPGVHVDFDRGLGNAVLKLRQALGDSAHQPRYIETLARRGYRLKVPVEWIGPAASERPASVRRRIVELRIGPGARRWSAWIGAAASAVLLLGWLLWPPRPLTPAPAREAYLRGVHFWKLKTPEPLRQSLRCFREATRRDPTWAAAHAGVAQAYHFLGAVGIVPRAQVYRHTQAAARRALQLDSRCAAALAILAESRFRFGGRRGDLPALSGRGQAPPLHWRGALSVRVRFETAPSAT